MTPFSFFVFFFVIVIALHSETINAQTPFEFLGCIRDSINGDILSSGPQSSPPSGGWSVQSCIDRAVSLKMPYAALRNGNQCYVTNKLFTVGKSILAPSVSQCSQLCPGSSLSCGGGGVSSFYFSVYGVNEYSYGPNDFSDALQDPFFTVVNTDPIDTPSVSGIINEVSFPICNRPSGPGVSYSISITFYIVTQSGNSFTIISQVSKTITYGSSAGEAYQTFSLDTPLSIEAGQRLAVGSGFNIFCPSPSTGNYYRGQFGSSTATFEKRSNKAAYRYKVIGPTTNDPLFAKLIDFKIKKDISFISTTRVSDDLFYYYTNAPTDTSLTFSAIVPDPSRVSIITNQASLNNVPINRGITTITVDVTINSFTRRSIIRIERDTPFNIEWASPANNNGVVTKRYLSFNANNQQGIRFMTYDNSNSQRFLWQWRNKDFNSIGQIESLFNNNNQCIDDWNGYSTNGVQMGTFDCIGGNQAVQKWKVRNNNNNNNNNNRMIQFASSDSSIQKCLRVSDVDVNNINNQQLFLTLSDCNDNDQNQLFNFVSPPSTN